MDVLARYRFALAERTGKPVGWQALRDLVMSPEDQRLAKERKRRDGIDVDTDRPRSELVSLEDFKGWYHPKKSHLPSDIKFQYIERFIRQLRITGEIDAIERALDEAQLEYIREALHEFYRLVPYADWIKLSLEFNMPRIESMVSYGCFKLQTQLLEMPQGQKGTCLLLLREYVSHITPVEIVLIRSNSEGRPPVCVPVFSGFLLAETVHGQSITMDTISIMGKLVLIRDTGATPADDGVRVLCEGLTLHVLATFRDDALELGINAGDDLEVIKPIFGLGSGGGAETDNSPLTLRRVDRQKYLPDGDASLFFRYRRWA